MPPGAWEVIADGTIGDHFFHLPPELVRLPAPADRSGVQSVVLDYRTGSVPLRIELPNGESAAGLPLRLDREGGVPRGAMAAVRATDAAGRTTACGCPGRYRLSATRQPFLDPRAFESWHRAHPDADPALRLIDLGTIDLARGDNPERTIQLPPEWRVLPD